MAELSKHVELVILHGSDGSQVVTERRDDGLIEVVVKGSLEAARAWVEAHYESVEWPKARLATTLIGSLRGEGQTR
jgi:hypothetical protein